MISVFLVSLRVRKAPEEEVFYSLAGSKPGQFCNFTCNLGSLGYRARLAAYVDATNRCEQDARAARSL